MGLLVDGIEIIVFWTFFQIFFSMRSIQHLPDSVHSSVQSGIILSDSTRLVEELIFNSLDAGSSKVSPLVCDF